MKVCPVGATWQEPDGIMVVDYDWCIGCRYCMAACPYWARRFNWSDPGGPGRGGEPEPALPGQPRAQDGRGREVHVLHPPHARGRLPACAEACPTGARVFGNLLDPDSEIRWVLANKQVFRLKEDLKTEPRSGTSSTEGDRAPREPFAARRALRDGLREPPGAGAYHLWMGALTLLMLRRRLCLLPSSCATAWRVTGMNDHVSWGLYISNFTFLVGLAAAAVMLVLPAYVLEDVDFSRAVLMAKAVAVAALVMASRFVVVDIGNPERLWHLIPGIGFFNWPRVAAGLGRARAERLPGAQPAHPVLHPLQPLHAGARRTSGSTSPAMYLSVMWAVSIHLVTAFLSRRLPARPFWNTALLGPRFLASAFTAGPAFVILLLRFIRRKTRTTVADDDPEARAGHDGRGADQPGDARLRALLQVLPRRPTTAEDARYLFFGLDGHHALVPWIWTSVALDRDGRRDVERAPAAPHAAAAYLACAMLFVGILIEKGIGTIIPGFIPEPWGKIAVRPDLGGAMVSAGLWALGAFVFTVLAKAAIPIELSRTSRAGTGGC